MNALALTTRFMQWQISRVEFTDIWPVNRNRKYTNVVDTEIIIEPSHEKTSNLVYRPGPTQIGLYIVTEAD